MMDAILDIKDLTGTIQKQSEAQLRGFDWQADATRSIPPEALPLVDDLLHQITALDPRTDVLEIVDAVQAFAYGAPGICHTVLPAIQASIMVGRCGTGAQQESLQAALAAKHDAVTLLLTESNGRGPGEWETIAEPSGTGWSINGAKIAVNNNGGKLHLIAARTAKGEIAAFLTEGRPAGLATRNAPAHVTIALGASNLTALALNDVELQETDQLASGDDAFALHKAVAVSRLLLGAVSLGAAMASAAYARGWVVKRTAFGKPLAAFEGVAFDVADIDTRLQAAQLMLRKAVYDADQTEDAEALDDLVARALSRVTAICASAAIDGVQLMGVHGIIHEHPQELFHRTASALSTLDTDPLRGGFNLF